jgi:hypothetical protein
MNNLAVKLYYQFIDNWQIELTYVKHQIVNKKV